MLDNDVSRNAKANGLPYPSGDGRAPASQFPGITVTIALYSHWKLSSTWRASFLYVLYLLYSPGLNVVSPRLFWTLHSLNKIVTPLDCSVDSPRIPDGSDNCREKSRGGAEPDCRDTWTVYAAASILPVPLWRPARFAGQKRLVADKKPVHSGSTIQLCPFFSLR